MLPRISPVALFPDNSEKMLRRAKFLTARASPVAGGSVIEVVCFRRYAAAALHANAERIRCRIQAIEADNVEQVLKQAH